MVVILIIVGAIEVLLGLVALFALTSDIQILLALTAFGFGFLHIGIAHVILRLMDLAGGRTNA